MSRAQCIGHKNKHFSFFFFLYIFLYLVGFGIIGRLGIFCLFNVLHHFSDEGVTVVLILGHDDLKDKPESSENGIVHDIILKEHFLHRH